MFFDEIQSVCRDFRRHLIQTRNERIEDYLPRVDESARKTLFQNLLLLGVEFRRRSGEHPTSDEYIKRFPQFAPLIRHAFFESTIMSMDALRSESAEGQTGSLDSFAQLDSKNHQTFELPAATQLGGYELIRELGRGGSGVVYAARHLQHQNHVALKTLPTEIAGQSHPLNDAERLHRFRREFRSLSEINHPNLVGMQTLEVDGSQWFLTMDLVKGFHFLSFVRPDGELNEERLRGALAQLVNGVIELHRQHIIHRDLKPSNVIVEADGKVVILDFGLVVELEQWTDQTTSLNSAHFTGTPRYAAPEQMFGEWSEASDWYAVGVMLYEALAGERPFRGSFVELLHKKQSQDPPALADRDDVPNDLGALTLIAKSSKHENAKQPHWAQARSSCWGTRSPPL